jgi:tetratricopeptide (TPR) repeat protein
MLVTPATSHFEMVYSERALDWFALATTWVGILLALVTSMHAGFRRATARFATSMLRPLGRALAPAKVRIPLNILLVLACIAAAVTVRYRIRDLDATYRAGQQAYQDRRFEDVVTIHGEYVRDDRDTAKIATALLQLGVSYTELGRPELAIDTLERLRFSFPNIDYGAQTLFHLAKNYLAIHSREKAVQSAELLEKTYPETSWPKRLRKENPDLFASPAPAAPSVPAADSARS